MIEKERAYIFLWLVPVVALFYYWDRLPVLVYLVVYLVLFEITQREPFNGWMILALIHASSFMLILQFSSWEVIFILVIVMMNDTFAYLGGKCANFHPIMKKHIFAMSPKKTLGGAIYGLLAGIVSSLVLIRLFSLHSSHYLWRGVFVCVLAIVGDLFESKFKRIHGIKDSGDGLFTRKIFWGHGGAYDRFDAASLACLGWWLFRSVVV
jgi:phosphatidate cytidylyltransferase